LALGEGAAIAVHEAARAEVVVALGSAAHGVDQLDPDSSPETPTSWAATATGAR
jgi:hypothetical protein